VIQAQASIASLQAALVPIEPLCKLHSKDCTSLLQGKVNL
jgi:hypothetical protein